MNGSNVLITDPLGFAGIVLVTSFAAVLLGRVLFGTYFDRMANARTRVVVGVIAALFVLLGLYLIAVHVHLIAV
jgi:hypothetical protein